MNILIPMFLSLMISSPYDTPTININNNNSLLDLTTETLTLVTNLDIVNYTDYVEQYTYSEDITLSDYIDGDIYYLYIEYSGFYIEVYESTLLLEYERTFTLINRSGSAESFQEVFSKEILLTETYNYLEQYTPINVKYLAYDYLLYDGYNRGFNEGLDTGYENGYKQGVNDGRAEGNGVNNVITWFGNVWDALTNFLNLEIAPNVKIGGLITIPIVIGALMFTLKALIK